MRSTRRDIKRLKGVLRRLTVALVVVGLIALVFTVTSVTLFAIRHGVHPGVAWLLDPMVVLALGTVLITDGVLAEYGIKPRGWSTVLRYFAGLSTWVMNCWSSVWPPGTPFGSPDQVDAAGLVLHSIPPVLLIALAEAVTHYRGAILTKVVELEDELAEPERPSVAATPPEPAAVPAPVPVEVRVPVAYPKRPETVPAGVRLLPIVARPEPAREAIPAEPQTVVPAGEPARTRVESDAPDGLSYEPWRQVRGDDTPGPESGVEAADPLTEQVYRDFPEYSDGRHLIPYRLLRERYGIGQDRARRIRDALRTGQPTSSTTETYSEVLA